MGHVPLCQNCNEPGHISPHCQKPQVQRQKVNYVATSGTKNDVSVQLADWENEAKTSPPESTSKIRFDPQIITIPSSLEGWPSDSAWDTFGVSTRSRGETKTSSTKEEKKKKGKKQIEVSVETSSDSDSKPVKRDMYKDDISSIVREALKKQSQDAADLEAYHEEIRALYISGLESESEKPVQFQGAEIYNLPCPLTEGEGNLDITTEPPQLESKKWGDIVGLNGKFADLLEEAKRAVPDQPIPEREDTDIAGATTFKMTEGIIRKEDWKSLEMSDLKGILPQIGTHRIDLQPGSVLVRQRYNQVFLRAENCDKTTFTTDWGTFAYKLADMTGELLPTKTNASRVRRYYT
ncbi:hypothetical protein R1sor_022420 [Riccia sorocarpa]|uniref:CCHC-type domain-containing protein n=1 Tax=Riccia sorocarpa TaxID=122646 RepID=A0ABD3GP14_9MARC